MNIIMSLDGKFIILTGKVNNVDFEIQVPINVLCDLCPGSNPISSSKPVSGCGPTGWTPGTRHDKIEE
jgi:hypothetical protein